MKLTTTVENGLTIACPVGELNSSSSQDFIEELLEHAVGDGQRLAIDMSGLTAIDSTGLSALITLVVRSRMSQGSVMLVAPGPLIRGVLDVTRLDQMFDIYESLDQAVATG